MVLDRGRRLDSREEGEAAPILHWNGSSLSTSLVFNPSTLTHHSLFRLLNPYTHSFLLVSCTCQRLQGPSRQRWTSEIHHREDALLGSGQGAATLSCLLQQVTSPFSLPQSYPLLTGFFYRSLLANRIDLPPYESFEILVEKLTLA